ncbi:hypothetical protein [Halorussus ruber]|uniref:hypothetical protein n=1 Tax=Halorussus ruber TaxID=1126238 RepID=UPI001091AF0A|nr:hypothetical protein [Halorussus ruber]
MPSDQELSLAKDTLLDYSQKLGDEIIEREVFEQDSNVIGFTALDETYSAYYNVYGTPQFEFFQVMFRFSLSRTIANRLGEETVTELVDKEENPRDVGNEIINKHDETELEWLEYQLKQRVLNSDTFCEIDTTEKGKMNGFSVFSLVFPYEDNFSLSDYYSSTEAVLNTGEKGSDYLHHSVQVSETDDEDIELNIRI